MAVKVAINGYGNIGKRVADAVAKQDDMTLVGVAKTRPNFEAFVAVQKGYTLYASEEDKIAAFNAAGLEVAGTTMDMLGEADVVVDATPEGMGAQQLSGSPWQELRSGRILQYDRIVSLSVRDR
jgi:glyceraldehyde-3-phosphate dehydrogenase (NAD(P))